MGLLSVSNFSLPTKGLGRLAYANINNKNIEHVPLPLSLLLQSRLLWSFIKLQERLFYWERFFVPLYPLEQRICCDKHNIPIPVALVHQCKLIYQFVAKVSLSVEVGIFPNWILENFGQRSPAITLIFFKAWEIPCFFNLSPNGTPGCTCKLGFNLVGVIAVVSRISKKKKRENV